jgi:hypothetical protein
MENEGYKQDSDEIQKASSHFQEAKMLNKKHHQINLCDQLKSLLDSDELIFLNSNNKTKNILTIDFDFTLRGILHESILYLCVFEDIPLNIFNHNLSSSSKLFSNERDFFSKMQNSFFKNIDEEFKKLDNFQFYLNEEETPKVKYKYLISSIRREITNTIILKLSDLRISDLIVKQITEHLKKQLHEETEDDFAENFKFYLNFDISQQLTTTSHFRSGPNNISSSANFSSNNNSSSISPNHNFGYISRMNKNASSSTQQQQQQQQSSQQKSDNDNNNLVIMGLFYLTMSAKKTSNLNSNLNKLVLFFFNCNPDIIKSSLLNAHKNVCLIRKQLFTKKLNKPNNLETSSSSNAHKSEYKFYYSDLNVQDSNSKTKLRASDLSYKNLIKNSLSISEIIKYHLDLSSSNDFLFLNYLDLVEETSAKLYIKSLIHYLSEYSINFNRQKIATASSEKLAILDTQSIDQLLKLGKMNKIVDIDLTEHFKHACKHLTNLNENENNSDKIDINKPCCLVNDENCENSSRIKLKYLENKFDEIFTQKIDSLPGINDLFIFSSKFTDQSNPECLDLMSQTSSFSANKKDSVDDQIDQDFNSLTPLLTETDEVRDCKFCTFKVKIFFGFFNFNKFILKVFNKQTNENDSDDSECESDDGIISLIFYIFKMTPNWTSSKCSIFIVQTLPDISS